MPFTPFHFGIALLLFSVMPFLDPLALFVGSVVPDIEGITAIFIFPDSGLPLHGPLHSFFGAVVLGILTGVVSYFVLTKIGISETLNNILSINITLKKSILSAFLGTFSHTILDAPLYNDMDPFLPLIGNPTDYTDNPLYSIVPYT
ncbi:MAG: hypothetical protein ACFFDT_22245, partial [Candidatus Hodarchaeota archaeon]